MKRLEQISGKAAESGNEGVGENRLSPSAALTGDGRKQALPQADPCIVACHEPDSLIGEQYRKLKTAVLRLTREDFRNVLMVTSALSGEGKSITCTNLAVMLARDYGHTVLLVDADLRRPSLQRYLGIDAGVGLTDCLEDHVDAGRAIVKTGVPKLSFMPSGKKAADPAELLCSYRFRDFLKELKHRYPDRYIILDTSPVLLFAETQAISAHVDGILAVVREGVASAKNVKHMLELVNISSVLGIIFNDSTNPQFEGRYRHYYTSYYSPQAKAVQETVKK